MGKKRDLAKIIAITKLYRNWLPVILERLNIIKLKQVRLKNGLKFNLGSKGSRPAISETIGDKRYTIFRGIKKNDVVVDIGAYIGDFSILAGSKGAKVYSYEPIKESFDKLNENIKLNNFQENIKSFNMGVYTFSGKSKINLHKLLEISSLIDAEKINRQSEKTGAVQIELTTLKQIFKDNNLNHIDFLKIDTEGSEADIIMSTPKEILRKIKYIAMESTDYASTNTKNVKLLNYLVDCGFKVEIISANNTINILKIYATQQN